MIPRGELVDDYLRILAGIQPKAFLFENVKGLRTIDGGSVYDELLSQMRKPAEGLGYEVSPFCLNAADFGVPQNRERIFIFGSSFGTSVSDSQFHNATTVLSPAPSPTRFVACPRLKLPILQITWKNA